MVIMVKYIWRVEWLHDKKKLLKYLHKAIVAALIYCKLASHMGCSGTTLYLDHYHTVLSAVCLSIYFFLLFIDI